MSAISNTTKVAYLIKNGIASDYAGAIAALREQLATRYRYLFLDDGEVKRYIDSGELPNRIFGPTRALFYEPTETEVEAAVKEFGENTDPKVVARVKLEAAKDGFRATAEVNGKMVEAVADLPDAAVAELANALWRVLGEAKDG